MLRSEARWNGEGDAFDWHCHFSIAKLCPIAKRKNQRPMRQFECIHFWRIDSDSFSVCCQSRNRTVGNNNDAERQRQCQFFR